MLAGVQYCLAAVRRLDNVVLGPANAIGLWSPVQHKFAAAATSLPRRQVTVVSVNITYDIRHFVTY